MPTNGSKKLAILIDADNAPASACSNLLEEVSKFGISSVKRAYGDWTTNRLKSWKEHLHKHAIQPIQQFSYTTGKNSTDSSLIIDAMDLLHAGNLDGFCLVSSDSDFTRLATRIRESGLVVYGIGEKKTPEPFIAACNQFVFIEILNKQKKATGKSTDKELETLIVSAIEAVSNDDGWATLAAVGGHVIKNKPSFDSRNYGYSKLSKLIKSLHFVEVKEEKFRDGSSNVHYFVKVIED